MLGMPKHDYHVGLALVKPSGHLGNPLVQADVDNVFWVRRVVVGIGGHLYREHVVNRQ